MRWPRLFFGVGFKRAVCDKGFAGGKEEPVGPVMWCVARAKGFAGWAASGPAPKKRWPELRALRVGGVRVCLLSNLAITLRSRKQSF